MADPSRAPCPSEKHLVLLRDGRTLIGYLRSIDQFGRSAPGGVGPGFGCNPVPAECGGCGEAEQSPAGPFA